MPKKEKEPNSVETQDLVIFKESQSSQSESIDKYTFETVDQENKIKLSTDYRPFGSGYQYSILIDNQSLAPVSEMKIKVKFPKFLTLKRLYPNTIKIPQIKIEENLKLINLEFDELNEKTNKQIHLHFSPNSLDHIGEVRTIVTYVNNKDTVRVLDSRPAEITLYSIIVEPKVVPSSFIRDFTQTPGIKKVIKSMGIGTGYNIDSEIYYAFLEQVFSNHNFQMVTKDIEKRILWYFGTESVKKEDILAIGQIVSNKIEIIASSLNHYSLISLITQITDDFKRLVVKNNIVNSKDKIFDLECQSCGVVLPYFPHKSEYIECNNCNFSQLIW